MKAEGRNQKSERTPKAEIRIGSGRTLPVFGRAGCLHSAFGSRASFGFRVSPFGLRSQAAFTLIELILVMALLTMAASITAPTLAKFFRGRTLDLEARRLLAMTRNGQNRAIAEGIPIDLWVDPQQGLIGLDAEPSFEKEDPRAVQFDVDTGVQIEVVKRTAPTTQPGLTSNPFQPVSTASVPKVNLTHPALPTIRFLPDGTLSDTSPEKIRLTGRDGISLWVALAQDKMHYEIRSTDN